MNIKRALKRHKRWLNKLWGGRRFDLKELSGADLAGADLRSADLKDADLDSANLCGADLYRANFDQANLRDANLSSADISAANFRWANLHGATLVSANATNADFRYANLYAANLTNANLHEAGFTRTDLARAKLPPVVAARLLTCPQTGAFEAWKKCDRGVIVRLRIPADAARSSATGRKCRAERAEVLEVIGAEVGVSSYDGATEYRVGEVVECHEWGKDRWTECSGGIHFFITREEAQAY